MTTRKILGAALLVILTGCSREALVRRAQNVQDGAANGYAVRQAMSGNNEIWAQGGGGGSSPIIKKPPVVEETQVEKPTPPAANSPSATFIYVPPAR